MKSFTNKSKHRSAFTKIEFVVVAAILSLMIGFLFMIGIPRPVLPQNPPNEKNRVFYREGNVSYSMVCPEDWYTSDGANITSYSDTNVSSSSHPLGRIYVKGIAVKSEEYLKATQHLEKTMFQGREAFKETDVSPPRKMLVPSGYSFEIHFWQDNVWYRLTFCVNKKLKEFPPSIILDYFNTFRIEPNDELPIGKEKISDQDE